MHYLLFYEVGDDYASRREEFREAHLEKAWKASERGELILGGALANPMDGAVLLFKGDSSEVAGNFARNDPYVKSGAVKRWFVREWTTVAGEDAARPVRPSSLPADNKRPSESWDRDNGMIARMWSARATTEKAGRYAEHATSKVFPKLGVLEGHRGAYLLQRAIGGVIELVVLTLWESMDAVRKFAGSEPAKAVVDPEARSMLADFDDTAAHFEVVHAPKGASR
jgi:uncharacterized protein YciI/heme-degrading monooxygenase HmoA